MPILAQLALSDSINVTDNQLQSLVDGGNTESLNETVTNAEENEALKLRNKLLQKSPFLSDTVMINSVTIEDILPAIMLKQILVENPSAAKSVNLQNALNNRQNPLPDYMRDEINLGRDTLSPKENMEIRKSAYIHERENLINQRFRNLLNDSLPQSADTLENMLLAENNLLRSYQLVDFYSTKGEIQQAQAVFANIPQNFELSPSEMREYNKSAEFNQISFAQKTNNKSWFDMSNEQKQIIVTLSADSTTKAGMQARAVLSLIDRKDYGFHINFPEIEGGNKSHNSNPPIYTETFSIYPNPANDYFIIDYALNEKESIKDVTISLFDNSGLEIMNFPVKTSVNQFVAECENLKDGTYWCRKFTQGKVSVEQKVIISRGNSLAVNDANQDFIQADKQLQVYPNPAKDYFIIRYNTQKSSNLQIVFIDNSGKILISETLNEKSGEKRIYTNTFSSGIYTLSLKSDVKVLQSVKVVIK